MTHLLVPTRLSGKNPELRLGLQTIAQAGVGNHRNHNKFLIIVRI